MDKHRTRAIVDQSALRYNIEKIKALAPNSPIIAMVKANAYGHGVEKISHTLASYVAAFGVACFKEAKALRALFPYKPIVMLEGVCTKEEWSDVFAHGLDVIFHDFWQVGSFLAHKKKNTMPAINAWIKIDTGMHRLGFKPEEVPAIYERLYACDWIAKPIGLMTHFACSDEMDNPMTQNQMDLFKETIQSVLTYSDAKFSDAPIKISLANSGGILAWPESYSNQLGAYTAELNYIRPGIMLYGISPFANKIGTDLGLKPVMTLQSHIIAIKTCKKGESVGYGATWIAPEDTRIAVVSAGYGDGYPRHISKDAVIWMNNHYLPVIGRVSMDMLMIDVSSYPEIRIGDPLELWGEHLPVEHVARFAGASPYELVTQVSERAR